MRPVLKYILILIYTINIGAVNSKEPLDYCGQLWQSHKTALFEKDKTSLSSIAFAIAFKGLVLPGTQDDEMSLRRYGLHFAMYALDDESERSYKFASSFVSVLSQEKAVHPVLQCLVDNKKSNYCIELAIDKKTILPFDELIKDIKYNARNNTRSKSAYCSF